VEPDNYHDHYLHEAAQAVLERLPFDVDQLDFEHRKEQGATNTPDTARTVTIDLPLYDYLIYADRTALQKKTDHPGDMSFWAACPATTAWVALKTDNSVTVLARAFADFPLEKYRTDRTPLAWENPAPWFAIGEYVTHSGQPDSIGLVIEATRGDDWTLIEFRNPDPFLSGITWCLATDIHVARSTQLEVFRCACEHAQAEREDANDKRKNPPLDAQSQRLLDNRLKYLMYEFGIHNVLNSMASTLESDAARTENYPDMPDLHRDIINVAINHSARHTHIDDDECPF